MLKRILLFLGAIIVVLIAIVLINTFRAKPWPIHEAEALRPLPDSACRHLSEAIQIPTISYSDTTSLDTISFKAFNSFIERAYPLTHRYLTKTLVKQFSIVFEWKGQNPALAPIVLMGHYDVVPVEPASLDKWTVAPFSGKITDSCVWGRGAADDKSGVISRLEAIETLLQKGFAPQRTIFVCFGHDEEIGGGSARAVVNFLQQKNVKAEMVLDEGGETTANKIKEVKRPVAVIGVAEKGYATFELIVEKEGGHSSMPDKETAIDILASGLHRLRSKTPPSKLTPPVREFLNRIGTSSDIFINKMASTNMWLFEGMVKNIIAGKPEGSAMLHTTVVPTIIEAGVKDNVIPSVAKAVVNSRILPGESAETVESFIRKTIHDDRIQIRKVTRSETNPSEATSIESPAFKRVESATYKTVPNVIPAPYLMIGATDSRYYRAISNGVVNFLPQTDSKGFHGINERLSILDLQRSINFIMTIIEESDKEFK